MSINSERVLLNAQGTVRKSGCEKKYLEKDCGGLRPRMGVVIYIAT